MYDIGTAPYPYHTPAIGSVQSSSNTPCSVEQIEMVSNNSFDIQPRYKYKIYCEYLFLHPLNTSIYNYLYSIVCGFFTVINSIYDKKSAPHHYRLKFGRIVHSDRFRIGLFGNTNSRVLYNLTATKAKIRIIETTNRQSIIISHILARGSWLNSWRPKL